MNRENLQKLADGLRGPLALEFGMGSFVCAPGRFIGSTDESLITNTPASCGTCACAVGHSVYLVAPKLRGEDFQQYSSRIFGFDASECYQEWDWCFSALWERVDNSPEGCADRIEWILKHGLPAEEDVEAMLEHGADLCYRPLK